MPVSRFGSDPGLADAAGRIADVSLQIVQDELELARLEIVDKIPKIGGSIVRLLIGAVLVGFGGLLAVLAVIWALADYVFGFNHVWASFAVVAAAVILVGAVLAFGALRAARAVGAPVPSAAVRHLMDLRRAVRS